MVLKSIMAKHSMQAKFKNLQNCLKKIMKDLKLTESKSANTTEDKNEVQTDPELEQSSSNADSEDMDMSVNNEDMVANPSLNQSRTQD